MRILHVISDLDPAAGGPPMVVSRLAAAQADLGHEVHLVIYDTPAVNDQIDQELRKIPGGARLILHRVPEPTRVEWFTASAAQSEMRRLAPKVDIFHLQGVWDPILRGASRVARRMGKPYVLAPHGMLDPWALSEKPLKKKIALRMGYGAVVARASLLHAHSAYEAECLRQGINGRPFNEHVEVIPNGVFLDEFRPAPPAGAYYKAHPELQNQAFILFLARLHEVKGLDILADAFAQILPDLPTTRLVIAGPDFGMKNALIEQVRRLGIADRVHLVGPQYGQDKLGALYDAAVFCLPSKHESFGMSVAEAMICGTPVVISENCHFPDVAEAGAGSIVAREAGAVARALREILSNAELARRMGEAGMRLVENKYIWSRVAARSIEAYQAVLDRSGAARAG